MAVATLDKTVAIIGFSFLFFIILSSLKLTFNNILLLYQKNNAKLDIVKITEFYVKIYLNS